MVQLTTFMTLLAIFKNNYFTPRPIVKVPGVGKVRGTTVKSALLRRNIYGFWGVPYALPPTGVRTPDRVIGGITGRPPRQSTVGSEDCLNLAVFSPNLRPKKLMPVIVFIHGGAFFIGSYTVYGPQYLLDHDVVLVNIHYRLSGLGFLCLNTKESSSNVGLLDQVLALKWVQKHIRSFGGDPNRVTIFGESAGSISGSYLLSSPVASGLFRNAILSSGSSLGQFFVNDKPYENAMVLGHRLGCPVGPDTEQTVRCLKYSRSKDQIIDAVSAIRETNIASLTSLGSETSPCNDRNFYQVSSSDEISNPVPTLVTSVRDEGSLFTALFVSNFYEKNLTAISRPGYFHHQFLVDVLQVLHIPGAENPQFVNSIKKDYFKTSELGSLEGVLPGLSAIIGRYLIKDPGYQFARLNAERAPTYLLSFEYENKAGNTFFNFLAPGGSQNKVKPGVAHADDLIYVFYTGIFDRFGNQDSYAIRRYIKIILDFVRTDVPYRGLPPISPNNNWSRYLHFGDNMKIKPDYTNTFRRYFLY